MISSQQALNETIRILKEHLSDVSGETGGSHAYGFYQLAQNFFVKFRVADHGLYMQTFVSHDNGVAPELVSIISVVYRESPKEPIGTKWKTNGYPNSIIAFQYVYPCWDMDFDDIPPIAFELITFAKTSTFVPPHLCTKDVKVQEITSDIGIRDVTNKLRARYCSIKESKTKKRIKIWYRGFDSEYGVQGEETPHLLWLTTDLNYAKEYGDAIMEYKIDMSKCHGSIDGMGYLFDFDMSEGPSAEYASYLLNEYGVNSYCYYGGLTESSYCMCLWDETPIVSQRILDNTELNESKNMKKNVVKINENTLRKIVAESVKKALNEQNPLLKNGYEVLNLVQAYQDDDSEEYIAMLQNMSEGCKKQVKEITGTSVDEMLSHWYAFHQAMIAIKKKYSELLTTDNNDGGYYDWR